MTRCPTEVPSTILVVESEPSALDLSPCLAGAGYEVRTAASPMAALRALEDAAARQDGLIDLVVLDASLPDMGAHQVCRAIRSHPQLPDTPVLLVVPSGFLLDRRAGLRMGADDLIAQPYAAEELLIRVRALVRIAQGQRELRKAGDGSLLEDLRRVRSMDAERGQVDHLDLLGKAAASVAHDVRNPLLTISFGVDYMRRALGDDARYQEAAQRVLRQADSLGEVINAFLAFARPPAPVLLPCDVASVLDRALQAVEQPVASKGITVLRDDDARLGEVLLDADQMARALAAFLLRISAAMDDGGELRLRSRRLTPEAPGGGAEGDEATLIEIEAAGAHITPDELAHLLEPFSSGAPKEVVWSLALLPRVVEEHGGWMLARGQPGGGVLFTISLPRRT